MTEIQHRDLASGRWWELSIFDQLGHVGSEISRATSWMSRNPDVGRRALYRALELLDLTLDDPRHRKSSARLREISRTREIVVDFFAGSNEYGSSAADIQRYFDAYARGARWAKDANRA